MNIKQKIHAELIKKGHEEKGENKVYNIANRSLLYATPQLAQAFLKLRSHPRYKEILIDTEIELIKAYAPEITEPDKEKECNLIDMGCGDGTKAKEWIASAHHKKIRYIAVSPSTELAQKAVENITNEKFPNVTETIALTAQLDELDEVSKKIGTNENQTNVVLLLGSIIASFDIHEYLFELSHAMKRGDKLIIGNGIRTGERFQNLDTYKHPLFEEWHNILISELGLDTTDASYDARFTHKRVESFYTFKKDKTITINGKEHIFKKGDEIITSVLYKFFEDELKDFCSQYFEKVTLAKDQKNEYALVFCEK